MRNYFSRALQDTLVFLGWPALLVPLFLVPTAGFTLHYFTSGLTPMMGEFQKWSIYGLAATGVIFVIMFAYNLACAPYRIERDARLTAEQERDVWRSKILEGSRKRRLSADQKSGLADAIRQSGISPPKIKVLYSSFSAESADFAMDIAEAIEMANIKTSVDTPISNLAPNETGIKILRGRNQTIRSLSDEIHNTLYSYGFQPERRDMPGKDDIVISIARNPADVRQ